MTSAARELFEQITALPEYYLTRTERAIFAAHADDILPQPRVARHRRRAGRRHRRKTGMLLRAACTASRSVLYQPIDVSPSALEEAAASLTGAHPWPV